ncbi:MAG: HD domain-containing protein [Candidatus Shapirobacteria bacterium]|jgi:GTP pyrophosphokinase|nr:HD domain-containing protein [Candidatus Shapirobacteria bacterium]
MILDLSLNQNHHDYWEELKSVLLINEIESEKIKEAYDFAYKAHEGQIRDSGEAYISHPAWVAKLIAQIDIGEEAIIAALLHDCLKKTQATIEEIDEKFGDEVALLVSGLSEVQDKTTGKKVDNTNVEIFRRFLFSSVDDVRILIIRLADKLHNGMTIESIPPEKQIEYAKRVMGIYSPIAEYVGLHYFKKRLDDIAFNILFPEEANKLREDFKKQEKDEIKAVTLVKTEIEEMLQINNIKDYEIEGRIKSLYSTYLKIKRKKVENIGDRVGIRILTDTVTSCYTILGLLHARYKYLPDEFDDYISTPKANGYRSIQTTMKWKNKITVEVQIRTKQMHEFNEFGPASHIAYKLGKNNESGMGIEWVKDLVKWQKSNNNVNNYKIKVLSRYVYVFTPKGDTIQLPKEATALDFAYRIHTDVGDHCLGAKINNKMVRIDQKLNSGDVVEIILTKNKNVCKNWLDIVTTSFAKEHIRKMTSESERFAN